ncbi:hypothetical protein PoB_001060900 [Plakobranchus ocellatus]|uniref:Uncharacterized protein n=1 Tax=Plakobranchus ocellatus TaxID=259542 RepID=A0AAV3YM61_9GAST|nr:hypothetical protein PoB_001060900 [Plakobranchus ocellatus]
MKCERVQLHGSVVCGRTSFTIVMISGLRPRSALHLDTCVEFELAGHKEGPCMFPLVTPTGLQWLHYTKIWKYQWRIIQKQSQISLEECGNARDHAHQCVSVRTTPQAVPPTLRRHSSNKLELARPTTASTVTGLSAAAVLASVATGHLVSTATVAVASATSSNSPKSCCRSSQHRLSSLLARCHGHGPLIWDKRCHLSCQQLMPRCLQCRCQPPSLHL